jgi:hypothetical protein
MPMFKYEIEPLTDIVMAEAYVEAIAEALSDIPPKYRQEYVTALYSSRRRLLETRVRLESFYEMLLRTRGCK